MRSTLGYHLTFHPYGTWLPGDDRGWTARPGGPVHLSPHPALAAYAREQLLSPAVFFNAPQRAVVAATISETCARCAWRLHASVVHADHVHVVVTADVAPERVMTSLKSWSTRRLAEAALPTPAKTWARHGSTRYLDDERRFVAAVEYVVRQGGVRF